MGLGGGSLHDGFGGFDGFGGSEEHLALLLLVLQNPVPRDDRDGFDGIWRFRRLWRFRSWRLPPLNSTPLFCHSDDIGDGTICGTLLGTPFGDDTFRSTLVGTFPAQGFGTSLSGSHNHNFSFQEMGESAKVCGFLSKSVFGAQSVPCPLKRSPIN